MGKLGNQEVSGEVLLMVRLLAIVYSALSMHRTSLLLSYRIWMALRKHEWQPNPLALHRLQRSPRIQSSQGNLNGRDELRSQPSRKIQILENEAINSRDSVRVSKGLKTGMVSAVSGLCQGIVGSHLKQEGMV